MGLSVGSLSFYFPQQFDRISSRNIDFSIIRQKRYDRVYILFAEQRTFLNKDESFFTEINVDLTLRVIEEVKNHCNKVIIYSTSELWNNYEGKVDVKDTFNYNYTPYIKSKEIISNHIIEYPEKYPNVHIIYPFNFNSPFRKEGFLFSKIFDSLINKTVTEVGDLNFKRDIIHPSIVVNNSMKCEGHALVGSGELINIRDFVSDIFSNLQMDMSKYILIDNKNYLPNVRKNYYSSIRYSNYNELIKLTLNDVKRNKIS